MTEFVLSDERVTNSHGFRLMNAGGNLSRFNMNPVMLHNHDDRVVIGKWKDLRVKNGQLIATPEFDQEDEAAVKLQGKVERGYLKGASVGIFIDRMDLLKDDEGDYMAATSWELVEASVVSIPSNANSIRLCTRDGVLLDEGAIQLTIQKFNLKKMSEVKKDPEPADTLVVLQGELKAAQDRIVQLEEEKKKENDARAEKLVSDALASGRLNATVKDEFIQMAKANFSLAEKVIGGMPSRKSLAAAVKPANPSQPEEKESYDYLQKYDAKRLAAIREEDPDHYADLVKKYAEGVRYTRK